MEYRNAPYEFRIADKAAGIVEARVNQLEVVDDYKSVFSDGFWDRAIAKYGKMPRILVDHEGRVAGKTLETRQKKDGGIFQHSTMQYNLGSQYGTDAYQEVRDGYYDEFSVGFITTAQHPETRDGQRVMVKDEGRWFETSQVLSGASPGTGVTDVRHAIKLQRRDAPEGSYEDLSQDLRKAIEEWLGGNWQDYANNRYFYVSYTMPDYVVIEITGYPGSDDSTTFLKFSYILGPDGEPVLTGAPQEVTPMYVPVSDTARGKSALAIASSALALDTRVGARNAAADAKRIQSVHDMAAELGATCTPEGGDATRSVILTRAYRLRLGALGIEV